MKEKDILWEADNLWVGRTAKGEYTLFKLEGSASIGFLQFKDDEQAIENGKALLGRPDLVEKLIHSKTGKA